MPAGSPVQSTRYLCRLSILGRLVRRTNSRRSHFSVSSSRRPIEREGRWFLVDVATHQRAQPGGELISGESPHSAPYDADPSLRILFRREWHVAPATQSEGDLDLDQLTASSSEE